jgi:hypothetical protein
VFDFDRRFYLLPAVQERDLKDADVGGLVGAGPGPAALLRVEDRP